MPHADTPLSPRFRRRLLAVCVTALVLTGCSSTTATDNATGAGEPATTERPASSTPPISTSTSTSKTTASTTTAPVTPETAGTAPSRQAELDSQLREAAWDDDVERARSLIAEGADINAKDSTQQSAYLIATSEGYLELLRETLEQGADIGALDSWNGTGLIRAAERGHALVVGELLQAGIDRDHVNRIGYQAIHEAVWFGSDVDSYHDTVRILAAGGAELDRPSQGEGLTPLEMARAKGYPGLAEILRTLTESPGPRDPDAELLAAAEAGDADRAALAIRAGADLETRNARQRTPLLLAAAADRLEVARLLTALGADVNAIDDQSDTPVLVTGVTGSPDMLDVMMPHHPDFEIYNRFGGTALIPASERGHVEYVRRAVTSGIDVNHINNPHWTALLEAVILGNGSKDYQEIVSILLANGADPSIADGNGVTALQHATGRGHHAIAALLAAH